MTTKQRLAWRSLALSNAFCLTAATFPILAAAGWIFRIELLTQIYSSLPAMQPNTVFGLVLAAISIFFAKADDRRSRTRWAIAYATAGVVSLLGVLTLGEYLLARDFEIDRIFIGGTDFAGRLYPGRPSPQTAANFAILGAGLLLYNFRPLRIRLGQACALLVGANATVALTGYLFDAREFYGFPSLSPAIGMAVNTAASFMLLALALLCSRPDEGMMTLVTSDTRSGAMARRIMIAGSFAVPLVGVLTRIPVLAGWYGISTQVSLFTIVILGIMLRTTWQSARLSEQDEIRAQAAFAETQRVNETLKQVIEERRIFEAKASEILSISADAIISIDENQLMSLFNEGAEKIFGYTIDETLGSPLEILIPERFRSVHREHLAKILAGPGFARRMNGAIVGRRKSGEEFPADATISKIEVSGKQILTVALRDITEQKKAENGQRLLARIASVVTVAEDCESALTEIARLAVSDFADFCIVDVVENDGRCRRLQVTSRDPSKIWECDRFMQIDPGQSHLIRPVIEKQQTVFIERFSAESIASDSQNEDESQALCAAEIHSVIVTPLLTHERLMGVIVCALSSASPLYGPADVRLVEEVARRAALSIENAQLFREAQRAVKTRDEVLAIVSHDLKNPLATIAILGQIVCRTGQMDADKKRDVADKIQRSVQEMESLIADLLDFGRIQSGTFSVMVQAERLEPILMEAIDSIRILAEAKGQTLGLDVSSALRPVAVDVRRIRRVMSNLLGNAVKFTPEGGTIQVSARQHSNKIIVSVADNGPGIPAEHGSRIFDWFWQAEENRFAGSGLGLSIARGIIEAHGGTIWAEDRVGCVGSLFSFSLPAERVGAMIEHTVA